MTPWRDPREPQPLLGNEPSLSRPTLTHRHRNDCIVYEFTSHALSFCATIAGQCLLSRDVFFVCYEPVNKGSSFAERKLRLKVGGSNSNTRSNSLCPTGCECILAESIIDFTTRKRLSLNNPTQYRTRQVKRGSVHPISALCGAAEKPQQ